MPPKLYRLLTLAQAYTTIDRLAHTHGCKLATLRVLAALSELDTTLYRIGIQNLIKALGCHHDTVEAGLRECLALGWLERYQHRHAYYTVSTAGRAVADSLVRAEKDARLCAIDMKPTKKRKYSKRNTASTSK